jgi:hypothetical protein
MNGVSGEGENTTRKHGDTESRAGANRAEADRKVGRDWMLVG